MYSNYELIFFFMTYSFLGWMLEVFFMVIWTGKFSNRGVLALPFTLYYGVAMVQLALVMPGIRGHYFIEMLAYLILPYVCAQFSSELANHVTGHHLWDVKKPTLFEGGLKYGFAQALVLAGITALSYTFLHPFVFMFSQLLPPLFLKIIDYVWIVMICLDIVIVVYGVRKKPLSPNMEALAEKFETRGNRLGNKIADKVWIRLWKNYPHLQPAKRNSDKEKYVFAQGICFHKLFWVFLISSLVGDLIETVFVWSKTGTLMSRSSVLYGPFSVVWGLGAALLTLLLHRLADKDDRYIFIGGFFIGGAYEYMASLILELVLGTKFWDYSDMPFNLNGRTNLLYCIFWGILALIWIKFVYPCLSRVIERIQVLPGMVLTWTLIILMIADLAISGLAILRYVDRGNGRASTIAFEEFLDAQYDDDRMENRWPNMRVSNNS